LLRAKAFVALRDLLSREGGAGTECCKFNLSFFFLEILVCRGEIFELIPRDQAYDLDPWSRGLEYEVPISELGMMRFLPWNTGRVTVFFGRREVGVAEIESAKEVAPSRSDCKELGSPEAIDLLTIKGEISSKKISIY